MSGTSSFAGTSQRVLVSGATGLLGRHIVAALRRAGHAVTPLVRGGSLPGAIHWQPETGSLSPRAVSGFDAVIHLAGEPVIPRIGRWTAGKKHRIYNSRVTGTATLAKALAHTERPPRAFICASGINVYGDCGAQVVDETTPSGTGFLADVCRAWEAASAPLVGVSRVVHMRIGVVLSPEGGMLAALLPLYRLGLGGTIGNGCNYISWISLEDLVRAVRHTMATDQLAGPVNLVSPHPVTMREFSRELAALLRRPAFLRAPAWAAHLVMGQLAEETLLSSVRAASTRLTATGFTFAQPTLAEALAQAVRLPPRLPS